MKVNINKRIIPFCRSFSNSIILSIKVVKVLICLSWVCEKVKKYVGKFCSREFLNQASEDDAYGEDNLRLTIRRPSLLTVFVLVINCFLIIKALASPIYSFLRSYSNTYGNFSRMYYMCYMEHLKLSLTVTQLNYRSFIGCKFERNLWRNSTTIIIF